MLTRIIIALVMTVGLLFINVTGWLKLALYEKSGDYLEAIAVMLFYQIG